LNLQALLRGGRAIHYGGSAGPGADSCGPLSCLLA